MESGAEGVAAARRLCPRDGAPRVLADRLAFAVRLCSPHARRRRSPPRVWRIARLLLDADKATRPQPVLPGFAGIPGAACPGVRWRAWLTVFAPRSQLVEFVLRENGYRRRMIE